MFTLLDSFKRDLRDGLRQLRVTPLVTGVAVLSLALGIGANTALFSLVHAMLLRGLPVHEPSQLVELNDTLTNPLWEELRTRQDAFTGVMAYSNASFNLSPRGAARTVPGIMVSGGAFDTLGLQPALGRFITADDDRRDGGSAGPVAVLSHRFWEREYSREPDVAGRTIALDGHAFTIIGVAPPGFTGLTVGTAFDIAVPIGTQRVLRGANHMLDSRDAWWLVMLGRLAPGQDLEAAQNRLRAIQPQVREATMPTDSSPAERSHYLEEAFTLQPAGGFSPLRRRYTQPLLVLSGIVAIVLLVACANLANLLLARAAARQRELAVRLSLGASRAQLVRQLILESLLLAFGGAAAGLAVAQAGSRLLVRLISTTPNNVVLDVGLDWTVLGFSIAVATTTGLLFGLAPAFRGTALRPVDALRQGGRTVAGSTRRSGIGQALVAVQVALSLVLVFAAALFVRSFTSLATQSLGFDADRVLTLSLDLRATNAAGTSTPDTVARVVERLQGVPGVSRAAAGLITPVSAMAWMMAIQAEGYVARSEQDARSYVNAISPDYFRTLGIPLLAGRDFSSADRSGSPRVAVVNEAFVTKFLSGRSPIGSTFTVGRGPRAYSMTIIGLTGNAKYRTLREEQSATAFVPMAQQTLEGWDPNVYVRSELPPASLTPAITSAVAEVNPNIVLRYRTLSEVVGAGMITERVIAMLSAFFGMLALMLAMIGLYGVMSYAVTRRRGEIGVRMALGAQPSRVLGMVMRDVIGITLVGLAAGAVAGLAGGRFVASLLYGLSPTDMTTLGVAMTVLMTAAACAGYLPARRAARVDPMTALRED